MHPSPRKRKDIIDALRLGTVPKRGLELFAVGMSSFERSIEYDLSAVAVGQGRFKAIRGEYGTGKTFFARWLEHKAREQGFASAFIQISERDTPLYQMERIYRYAMESLQTTEWSVGTFQSLMDDWIFSLEEEVLAKGSENNISEQVGNLLEKRMASMRLIQPQFAAVLRASYAAKISGNTSVSDDLIAWLMGQPNIGDKSKRTAGIKGEIDNQGASGFFRGLLELLRQTGRKGLVLVLDEVETIQRVQANHREKSLNALRQWIDDLLAGVYPGMYLVITGTPLFFDGPQGVQRLPPLAQRLHTVFSANPTFDNYMAPQIRLSPFDLSRMIEVGKQVRSLYSDSSGRIELVITDSFLQNLGHAVAGALGHKIGIAPRLFLKYLVDVLDRVDAHPDFNPSKDYTLSISDAELTDTERAAAGRSLSIDDIAVEV